MELQNLLFKILNDIIIKKNKVANKYIQIYSIFFIFAGI
jgi:hypothetical protein